jgi:hypothetical protein
MKKILILILLTTIVLIKVNGQNIAKGVKITGLTSNREAYLYGEPVLLYFSISNQTENTIYNWIPSPGVNVQVELIDLASGEKKQTLFYSSDNQKQKYRWSQQSPSEGNAFKPFQSYFFHYLIGETFSKEKVYFPKGKEAPVIERYASILPEGSYKLQVEFTLLPSKEKIQESHSFSINKVPAEEMGAFENYRKSLQYTALTHPAYGDGSYSSKHSSSIENFLKDYSESVYSQHLLHILTNWLYPYYKKEGLDESKIAIIQEYLKNDQLLPELRVERAFRAGVLARNYGKNIDKQEIFDKALKGVQNQSSSISEWVINLGDRSHKVKGLKNYACTVDK